MIGRGFRCRDVKLHKIGAFCGPFINSNNFLCIVNLFLVVLPYSSCCVMSVPLMRPVWNLKLFCRENVVPRVQFWIFNERLSYETRINPCLAFYQ